MSLVDYLEEQISRHSLSEEFYVKNGKGLLKSLLDNMFVVDLEKAIVKQRHSGFLWDKTVAIIEVFHGVITQLEIRDARLAFLGE